MTFPEFAIAFLLILITGLLAALIVAAFRFRREKKQFFATLAMLQNEITVANRHKTIGSARVQVAEAHDKSALESNAFVLTEVFSFAHDLVKQHSHNRLPE